MNTQESLCLSFVWRSQFMGRTQVRIKQQAFPFSEKLLGYLCDKDLRKFCWWCCPGWQNSGSATAARGKCFAHAKEPGSGRALWAVRTGIQAIRVALGNLCNLCKSLQSRINTGYFASC